MIPTPDPTGTVVLCGSVTRAVAALDAAERWYREQGYTVHKPVADPTKTPEEHARHWFGLIAACRPTDLVVICQVAGQRIGDQTNRELEYAFDCDVEMRHFVLPVTEERSS